MDDQTKGIDFPTAVRTREIRAEIDQTRGELTQTVNAIQDRLRPGSLAADAAESVKNTVKHAAGDRARMVAETAREIADSEPVQYVRAHPIPTAMVGIGVAGLAWLAFGRREERPRNVGRPSDDWRRQGPYDEADRYYRQTAGRGHSRTEPDAVPSAFGDAGFGESGYPGQGGYESAAAYSPDLYQCVDRFERGGSRRTSWAENAADDVSRSAADLRRHAQETGREAQQTLQRAWQQNPLVMGAASAVFGLMIGMAVPQTDVENEYMGEARDHAIDGVQQTVRETVTKVQDAASSAVGMLTSDAPQAGSAPAVRNQEQKPTGVGQPVGNPIV